MLELAETGRTVDARHGPVDSTLSLDGISDADLNTLDSQGV